MNTTITPNFTTKSNPIMPPKFFYTFYVVLFHGPTDTIIKKFEKSISLGYFKWIIL